jgi:hypothetical protein
MTTYTLSAEYINGEFLELEANCLTDFITKNVKINAVSLKPNVYKCPVMGIHISGTKKLMAHYIEVV